MKLLFCYGLCFLSLFSLRAQPPGAVVDVERYVFDIEVNDKNDSITAAATIECRLLKDAGNIEFDLISAMPDGKGMRVISVSEKGRSLKYTHAKNILTLNFPAITTKGELKTFEVRYAGIPADGLIITKNKFNERTFFSDHWPNRARNWLPCVDHPADKASVEFLVRAPAHYQVVSNGVLVEQSNLERGRKLTHYRETVPISTKIFAIGLAHFAVRFEGEVENTMLETWVFPQERSEGFYDYALATEILPFFVKNIGPFPFKRLANVQSKTIYGGMENAGAIFYAEKSVTGKRTAEVLMAHEISHQWFGDMVTEADFSHLWLSEGFVTYLAIMYMEYKYGQDTATKMRVEDRMQALEFAKQKSLPIVDSATTDYLGLLNANSYQKGGWVLHMLRKQLGDDVFWKCIRSYYAEYAGRNATTSDFKKIVEKVSGKDLGKYFKQWLFTAGHPVLRMQWHYEKTSATVSVNLQQQQAGLFEFPITVNVVMANGKTVSHKLDITSKNHSFSLPVSGTPTKVIVDPAADLFFEGSIEETRN